MQYLVTGLFILLDFGTGITRAIKQKKFTSSVMREGLFHKCASVFIVVLGILVDWGQMFLDLGFTVPISTPICIYIILMEMGSIIENVGQINSKLVPEKIKQYFTKLSDKKGE